VPDAQGAPAPKRPSRWIDRTVGIVLGLVLGIGVIVVFVFEGSEQTIDAPRISGVDSGTESGGGSGAVETVPLVRVVDGKPPPSGPVRLDFRQGQNARFLVGSNLEIEIEIPGYGVSQSVGPGRTLVDFRARKSGQYPVVVASTKIDVASLRVTPR
jgi:hypothetical protein